MIDLITSSGIALDILPNQDVAFIIENPFFSTDHIPVPWSTDMELPASGTNCKVFKFAPAMLLPPQSASIHVVCYLNGIAIMPCKAQILSYSRTSLKISLTGTDINDYITDYINNLPLAKWNFGKMTDLTEFWNLMQNATFGNIPEFATPLLLRSDRLDYSQDVNHIIVGRQGSYPTTEPMTETRRYWNSRFANFINPAQNYVDSNKNDPWERSGTPYLIPIVRLNYLLSLIQGLEVPADYDEYISKIGILAPNKKNALPSDIAHGGLDIDENGDYILSLADALPKVEISTFLKDILNILSAVIYLDNGKLVLIPNNTIVADTGIIDWTDKIADDYDCDIDKGYKYICGYQNLDNATREINPSEIQIVESYQDIFQFIQDPEFDKSKPYVFQHEPTGDIYSVSYQGTINNHPEFSLLQRGGAKSSQESEAEDSETTYDAKTNIKLVKSIPIQLFLVDHLTWDTVYMTAIVDIPDVGKEPSEDITIGILQDRQLVERGLTLSRHYVAGNFFEEKEAPSLLLYEDDPIYQEYHKAFAEFMAKPKTGHKLAIKISATEIANLQIWKKRLLYNQVFYIKSLEIDTNTSTDYLHTAGTFIRG